MSPKAESQEKLFPDVPQTPRGQRRQRYVPEPDYDEPGYISVGKGLDNLIARRCTPLENLIMRRIMKDLNPWGWGRERPRPEYANVTLVQFQQYTKRPQRVIYAAIALIETLGWIQRENPDNETRRGGYKIRPDIMRQLSESEIERQRAEYARKRRACKPRPAPDAQDVAEYEPPEGATAHVGSLESEAALTAATFRAVSELSVLESGTCGVSILPRVAESSPLPPAAELPTLPPPAVPETPPQTAEPLVMHAGTGSPILRTATEPPAAPEIAELPLAAPPTMPATLHQIAGYSATGSADSATCGDDSAVSCPLGLVCPYKVRDLQTPLIPHLTTTLPSIVDVSQSVGPTDRPEEPGARQELLDAIEPLCQVLHERPSGSLLERITMELRGAPIGNLRQRIAIRRKAITSLGFLANLAQDVGTEWAAGAAERTALETRSSQAATEQTAVLAYDEYRDHFAQTELLRLTRAEIDRRKLAAEEKARTAMASFGRMSPEQHQDLIAQMVLYDLGRERALPFEEWRKGWKK